MFSSPGAPFGPSFGRRDVEPIAKQGLLPIFLSMQARRRLEEGEWAELEDALSDDDFLYHEMASRGNLLASLLQGGEGKALRSPSLAASLPLHPPPFSARSRVRVHPSMGFYLERPHLFSTRWMIRIGGGGCRFRSQGQTATPRHRPHQVRGARRPGAPLLATASPASGLSWQTASPATGLSWQTAIPAHFGRPLPLQACWRLLPGCRLWTGIGPPCIIT